MDGERTGDRPDRDEVHTLLSQRRRRLVLEYLGANGSVATVPELAQYLVERTDGATANEQDEQVRLWHVDLPRFADTEVVEYDDDGRVELTATGEWLDRIRDETATVFESESV